MISKHRSSANALVGCFFAAALLIAPFCAAAASGATLHLFRGRPDGAIPFAPLIEVDGTLYGTTNTGGVGCGHVPEGCGTIFSVTPDGKERVLHRFVGGCDGALPSYAGLVSDGAGNLYGATLGGGGCDSGGGFGTVFKLTAEGKESVLYAFTGGNDGGGPSGSLIRDEMGNLYGVTAFGGNGCGGGGCGFVFEVSSDGTEKVLHAFTGGNDGFQPYGALVEDAQGNLYGTTGGGGGGSACQVGCGTVFKITPDGTETILYAFQGGNDGAAPAGNLILDQAGNLYGTTGGGGSLNHGVVFRLAPDGMETVLYSFKGGSDGVIPTAGVIMDKQGVLYGTTVAGGAGCGRSGCGTVFKLAPDGKETILLTLDKKSGAQPYAELVFGKNGTLYGTASAGGRHKNGVVFQVKK